VIYLLSPLIEFAFSWLLICYFVFKNCPTIDEKVKWTCGPRRAAGAPVPARITTCSRKEPKEEPTRTWRRAPAVPTQEPVNAVPRSRTAAPSVDWSNNATRVSQPPPTHRVNQLTAYRSKEKEAPNIAVWSVSRLSRQTALLSPFIWPGQHSTKVELAHDRHLYFVLFFLGWPGPAATRISNFPSSFAKIGLAPVWDDIRSIGVWLNHPNRRSNSSATCMSRCPGTAESFQYSPPPKKRCNFTS